LTLEGLLRSAVAGGTVAADTLVAAPTAIAAGMALGPTHGLVSRCYREFARVALLGFGARVATNGDAHLDPASRYVFVSNHASHLDALAILRALERHPLRFVAKEELGRIPLFGAALRATGNVFVRRRDTERDLSALDAAGRELLGSISLLFFAEGTRSTTGALGPFKRGAAAFAVKAGLPLVPIGVHGSADIYARGFEVKRAGTIGVAVGAPLEVAGCSLDDRDALTAALRAAVQALVEEARALAGAGGAAPKRPGPW
jgi:1-acyl-sn-glycerol-3-phosphate acyltransferase